MYKEELILKVKGFIRKYKVKCRSLEIQDNKLILGIEGYKSNYNQFYRSLKALKLNPVICNFGRWVFIIKDLYE